MISKCKLRVCTVKCEIKYGAFRKIAFGHFAAGLSLKRQPAQNPPNAVTVQSLSPLLCHTTCPTPSPRCCKNIFLQLQCNKILHSVLFQSGLQTNQSGNDHFPGFNCIRLKKTKGIIAQVSIYILRR